MGIILFIINQFTISTYDLNLYEYIKYSQNLTNEEITYLKEKGILRYTLEKNAPPFSFKDTRTGLYKGFVVDYASTLSIELNTDIEFIPMNWKEAIENVVSGEADITELHDSHERRRLLDFTQNLYTLKVIIITRKDQQDIKTAKDMTGHRVAIEAGDYSNEFINSNIKGVEIIGTVDYLEAINKLLNGEVDAITGDEPNYKDLPLLDNINIYSTGTNNELVYKGRYYNYYIKSFEYEKTEFSCQFRIIQMK